MSPNSTAALRWPGQQTPGLIGTEAKERSSHFLANYEGLISLVPKHSLVRWGSRGSER